MAFSQFCGVALLVTLNVLVSGMIMSDEKGMRRWSANSPYTSAHFPFRLIFLPCSSFPFSRFLIPDLLRFSSAVSNIVFYRCLIAGIFKGNVYYIIAFLTVADRVGLVDVQMFLQEHEREMWACVSATQHYVIGGNKLNIR